MIGACEAMGVSHRWTHGQRDGMGRARGFKFPFTALTSVPADRDWRKTKEKLFLKARIPCFPDPHTPHGSRMLRGGNGLAQVAAETQVNPQGEKCPDWSFLVDSGESFRCRCGQGLLKSCRNLSDPSPELK